MIHFDEGIKICGRCVWGHAVGFIVRIDRETFTIRWSDGETKHLRPDDDNVEAINELAEAAE